MKNKEIEEIRNNVIEECAKELEKGVVALNKVIVREQRILQEDTLWVFEVEKEIRQSCVNILRRLKTNENTSI